MALREITGKRLRLKVRLVRTFSSRASYRRHLVREFIVYLECRHEITVPFGRRPQVGRRMRCPHCEEG